MFTSGRGMCELCDCVHIQIYWLMFLSSPIFNKPPPQSVWKKMAYRGDTYVGNIPLYIYSNTPPTVCIYIAVVFSLTLTSCQIGCVCECVGTGHDDDSGGLYKHGEREGGLSSQPALALSITHTNTHTPPAPKFNRQSCC